mgnify:CR=1 FL=1
MAAGVWSTPAASVGTPACARSMACGGIHDDALSVPLDLSAPSRDDFHAPLSVCLSVSSLDLGWAHSLGVASGGVSPSILSRRVGGFVVVKTGAGVPRGKHDAPVGAAGPCQPRSLCQIASVLPPTGVSRHNCRPSTCCLATAMTMVSSSLLWSPVSAPTPYHSQPMTFCRRLELAIGIPPTVRRMQRWLLVQLLGMAGTQRRCF